jgi:hypothetical protein
VAAPRGGGRRARAGGCGDCAVPAALTAFAGGAGPGGCHRYCAGGGSGRCGARGGAGGGTRRDHGACLVLARRSSAARHRTAASVVLAGHRPGGADRWPASPAVWLPVHPRRGRLGGPGRSWSPARLRQVRRAAAELPEGRSVAAAAFSPGGGQAVQLELVSMAGGRLMAVPGTWLSSDALISFGWPASSGSLVAELSFTTKVQLVSWRPPGPAGWPSPCSGHGRAPPPWSSGSTPPSVSKTGTPS